LSDATILPFTGETTRPISAEEQLQKAAQWGLQNVIVIGEDAHGALVWGASFSETEKLNFMLDRAKAALMGVSIYWNMR